MFRSQYKDLLPPKHKDILPPKSRSITAHPIDFASDHVLYMTYSLVIPPSTPVLSTHVYHDRLKRS